MKDKKPMIWWESTLLSLLFFSGAIAFYVRNGVSKTPPSSLSSKKSHNFFTILQHYIGVNAIVIIFAIVGLYFVYFTIIKLSRNNNFRV